MMTEQQKQLATKFIELLQAEIDGKEIEWVNGTTIKLISMLDLIQENDIKYLRIKPEPRCFYEVVVKRFNENLPNQEEIQSRFTSWNRKEATIDFEKAKTYFEDDPAVKVVLNIYELKDTVTEI